ncbi:cobalt transporter CbiM [Eubacterium oxidoreducens]|uniref:Cobalt/nickel transport system permease protein n=1 Tax=Eubacterium oxidoreducens TaxID=1732 RepID=A0A1G6ADM6_EUBOX|nr:cobalt transporter CbiM [Eubacterium oxidoreducens]SDB06521.1 cobalt/nickel transport system permease protein [Eubacterium oxidoreducens]
MHIPENYLSPATCAVMTAAMVPVWTNAVRKVKPEVSKTKMPLLGVGAAFSFVGMMFNVPMPGGTTGHAVGGTLIALMLGPNAACISVTIALLIQALLFGDGGILAFGANCFNMAFVLPYLGYAIYYLLRKRVKSDKGRYVAAGIGAYIGINAAALCAAIEFGVQPLLFTDAQGQALYCPYDLTISIPAMLGGHLSVFGIVEVIFTVALFAFIKKTSPDILREEEKEKINIKPVWILLAVLVVAVPLGLLAQGTAWGEWGAEEIAQTISNGDVLGYTPAGLENGFSLSNIFPDYTMAGIPDVVAYILSAVVGVAIAIIIFKLISNRMRNKIDFSRNPVDDK